MEGKHLKLEQEKHPWNQMISCERVWDLLLDPCVLLLKHVGKQNKPVSSLWLKNSVRISKVGEGQSEARSFSRAPDNETDSHWQ